MSTIRGRGSFDAGHTGAVGSSEQLQSRGTESARSSIDEQHRAETPHGLQSRSSSRERDVQTVRRETQSNRPEGARRRHTEFEIGSSSTQRPTAFSARVGSEGELAELASSSRHEGRVSRHGHTSVRELRRQHQQLVEQRQTAETDHATGSRELGALERKLAGLGEKKESAENAVKNATGKVGQAEKQEKEAQQHLQSVQEGTKKELTEQQGRVQEAGRLAGEAVKKHGEAQTTAEQAATALATTRSELSQIGTQIETVQRNRTGLGEELGRLQQREREQQALATSAGQRLARARGNVASSASPAEASQAPASSGHTAAATPGPVSPAEQTRSESPEAAQGTTPTERPTTPRTELRESEEQHRSATQALEATQKKIGEVKDSIGELDTKLEKLGKQRNELNAVETRQSEAVGKADEQLLTAKEAVKSTAETETAARKRLGEMKEEAATKVGEAERKLAEAGKLVETRNKELLGTKEALRSVTTDIAETTKAHEKLASQVKSLEQRLGQLDGQIETSSAALQRRERRPTSPQETLFYRHPVLSRANLPRVQSAPDLPELAPHARRPSASPDDGVGFEFEFTPATPGEMSRRGSELQYMDLGSRLHASGKSPLGAEGTLTVPKADSMRSTSESSAALSMTDVPHSNNINVKTLDGEAFALRNGTLYMWDNGTGTFYSELERVQQLKLGSNGHAYARAGNSIFALTETPKQSNGIASRELPCPEDSRVLDFTVSPAGSVAYITQKKPTEAEPEPRRELSWLTHGQETPTRVPLPDNMVDRLAGIACSPTGQVYVLDEKGEMWRGHVDDVLARAGGDANAVGWRRMEVPHATVPFAEITTLANGHIQVSSAPREGIPDGEPGKGPDNRTHFVLSLKDEWQPHENMSGNVLDLAYKDRLKNAAAERKGRVTLGIGAGKRSGWDHEQPPSLVLRGANQVANFVQNQVVDPIATRAAQLPAPVRAVGRAIGTVALPVAAVAATHAIMPVGRAAWLARPVAALVPTMIRNRAAFHASPPPVQVPGFEQREAQSRVARWGNFFSAAYGTRTERGARNANLRRELAVGTKLMQQPNAAIPPRPAEGGVDHYAVIRGDMVNKLTGNARTALDRIEKELGMLDAAGQPVDANHYRNNALYQRFQFQAAGMLKRAAGGATRVDDTNNVLHQLHRQAQALLQHTPEAQPLVDRLHDLMHVKQLYIPADEWAGAKDLTGIGARDTAHAFVTTQLGKIASDLGHTFKAVKAVTDKLTATSTPETEAATHRTHEVIAGMSREAVAQMDAPGEGRVNTEFNRYNNLADYATHTDPAIVEKQLVSELRTMRALPDDNRLSRLDTPQFEQLKKTYHDNTKLALDRFEAAIGLNDAFTAFQTTGTVPPTSKGAPYRQLQQRDNALVWSNQNALFDLYKRRMVALHGADPADVGPPGAIPPEGARGDVPLHEAIPIRQPAAEGELTARIEFLLRQGIHMPVEAPKTKPMEANTAAQPAVRGLWQKGPTPAADKAAHPDVNAPQGMAARAKNWFTSLRSTVVNSGLDVLLGQMVRCQLVAEQAAQEVARKSLPATTAIAQPSSSTAPATQDDAIRSATTHDSPAHAVPAEELAEIATRSNARIAGGKDNPAGALFEKGVVASTVERVAEKLRIKQMIATHPDHIVTRAINMQGTIHPEDVEAFARQAWRSLPTGSTIRLDHTLHLGIDFDGLGFSFRFVNRQLQGAPEVPGPDSTKNVLNIPLNSLFSFQPTPYFGQTKGSTVSLTKTTDGADIKMSDFTDREAKLLAAKLMWGAGRFGLHEAQTSDGKPSQDVLALIYWGFELLPNLLKISGRGTDELTFHLKNDNSGLAENAAVNILDRKASIDHLLEVCASIVESHKDSKTREHEVGFHPLAASVMIANDPDDRNTRFKAVAAGLIQAALTGTYSSEVEKTQGDGKVRTTTTAKRKSTNVVLKPIEVTELQFSKQWPWNSPVPINGIRPEVGDGIEMEHKIPTWIRVGILNVFQHNGLACGITTAPDGKVEGVSWGATTRHDFNEKSFPQLAQLRREAPTAYKNMMRLAREAESANTPVNVNMELTPDALDRLNNCRSESESIRILKNADNYRIKSVSAGEEYRYDSGTFFGFDFFRMDHKGSNTLSNPTRGLVEMVYPDPGDTRSAIEAKVRGEFTVGGGDPDFSRLDARLAHPEVENAILDVGVTKERVLLAMMAPQRATEAAVRTVATELHQPARATAGQDHFAMHNGEVVLRTRVADQWHQTALSTDQLNLLLSTPPNAPETAREPAGPRRTREQAPRRELETRAGESSSLRPSQEHSVDGSMTRSMEAGEEWRGELHAKQAELERTGAQPWAQKMLQAMSAGASVSFGHDPQALLGAAAVQALRDNAHHDATPASARLNAGRPVNVGEIIREMDEAGGRGSYPLDPAQQHVLATFFPGADGRFDATLVDQVLATDPYSFIRAADLVAGRVKPSLLARMDLPEVAAMGADRAPAAVPGVPVLGGISAGGA